MLMILKPTYYIGLIIGFLHEDELRILFGGHVFGLLGIFLFSERKSVSMGIALFSFSLCFSHLMLESFKQSLEITASPYYALEVPFFGSGYIGWALSCPLIYRPKLVR